MCMAYRIGNQVTSALPKTSYVALSKRKSYLTSLILLSKTMNVRAGEDDTYFFSTSNIG